MKGNEIQPPLLLLLVEEFGDASSTNVWTDFSIAALIINSVTYLFIYIYILSFFSFSRTTWIYIFFIFIICVLLVSLVYIYRERESSVFCFQSLG